MKKDLTGQRFGRLTVLSYDHKNNDGKRYWYCICDCGNEVVTRTDILTCGVGKSCGCFQKENMSKIKKTHGYTVNNNKNGNPTYVTWKNMKQRCYNSNADQYQDYGARGIKVCDRWKQSFENFVADMGERPIDTTIDRIDSNGNYEPDNCRWATDVEQNNNKRNSNRFIEYNRKRQTVAQWARESGINRSTIISRIKRGWTIDQTFNAAVDTRCYPQAKPFSSK